MARKKDSDADKFKSAVNFTDLAGFGINLVVTTAIGFGIGYLLDNLLGTSPWLKLIFFFLGVAAGFYYMFRYAKRNIDK